MRRKINLYHVTYTDRITNTKFSRVDLGESILQMYINHWRLNYSGFKVRKISFSMAKGI